MRKLGLLDVAARQVGGGEKSQEGSGHDDDYWEGGGGGGAGAWQSLDWICRVVFALQFSFFLLPHLFFFISFFFFSFFPGVLISGGSPRYLYLIYRVEKHAS